MHALQELLLRGLLAHGLLLLVLLLQRLSLVELLVQGLLLLLHESLGPFQCSVLWQLKHTHVQHKCQKQQI